jgi:quercetin dioxygenase-like cupin family protein
MTATDAPQMKILHTGNSFKVLHVTGPAGMCIPEHRCTKEAVITVQAGSAALLINGNEYSLKEDQSFIIPGGKSHSLNIKENFQAVVIMEVNSEIKFDNI